MIEILIIMIFLLVYACFPAKAYAVIKNNAGEITTQLLSGYVVSVIAAVVVGSIGTKLFLTEGACSSGQIGAFVFGSASGAIPVMILASAGSVYGIGQAWGHRNGSFGKSLLGALVPPLMGQIIVTGIFMLENKEDPLSNLVLGAFFGALPGSLLSPIGALIAYRR